MASLGSFLVLIDMNAITTIDSESKLFVGAFINLRNDWVANDSFYGGAKVSPLGIGVLLRVPW